MRPVAPVANARRVLCGPGLPGYREAMTAPTIDREQSDTPERPPGPAAVLAALAEFSAPETLAMIDAQVDEAYRAGLAAGDPEPLAKVLEHWWYVVRVNRGEAHPAVSADPRAEMIARWEAAHPGEKLFP